MIVIIDYGMGNLRSAQKGVEKGGYEAIVSPDPASLAGASGIILPGVGAFADCHRGLRDAGFIDVLRERVAAGTPLLGICVGMQLLFEYGEEGEGSVGLGFLPGRVVRFPSFETSGLKVPHMGWNEITAAPGTACPLLERVPAGSSVYFVHSYHPAPERAGDILATAEYGVTFPAIVGRDRIFGTQFHPEKSQQVGIEILRAFGAFVHETQGSATLKPSN